MKHWITTICKHCGKEFILPKWRFERKDRKSKDKFCSRECSNQFYVGSKSPSWKGGKKDVKCDECGIIFKDEKYHYEYYNTHFCSTKCMGIWQSKNRKGSNHPRYLGRWKNSDGYILISLPTHPFAKKGYVQEHRLVVEEKIGRYLTEKEVVHHLDGNRTNNKIENLMLFKNNSDHIKFHIKIKQFGYTNPLVGQILNRWDILNQMFSLAQRKDENGSKKNM